MDNSKQYVEMCEKAKEIQELWEPEDGDFVFYHHSLGNGKEEICVEVGHNSTADRWLPRQDQLQEMVRGRNPIPAALLWDFARWEDDASFSRYGLKSWEDLSFEMLWLAYVMHKLHNKVWNGTDWIAE